MESLNCCLGFINSIKLRVKLDMNFRKTLLTATALVAFPAAAQAQDAGDVQALRAEIAELKKQLAIVAAKVDESAKADEKKKSGAPEVKWKGAPELSGEGGWSFKPRGRIQYDVGTVSAPDAIPDTGATNGLGFGSEARRIRLGAEGTLPGGFGYKVEADIATGTVEMTDAFLTYKKDKLTVTAGQHNNFQGLEELSSSNDTSFVERAAFTDAFGFKRRVGLSAEYNSGQFLLQAGAFTDNITDLGDDGNDSIGVSTRAVFAPKVGKAQLHFGGNFSYTDLGEVLTSRRYRQRPLSHIPDIRFIDTNNIANAVSETSYGLEAAFISGRFHAAAETGWMKLGRAGLSDPTFFGGAIEGGIFLTDDSRSYKDGIFKSLKVKNPVNKGGLGAFQLNLRYDYLDLNEDTIIGGIQNSYQASLIWTPIDQIRFMLNYGHQQYDDAVIPAGTDRDYGVDAIVARAQVTF
jgi:phosphate-selective porin OprO and OprP